MPADEWRPRIFGFWTGDNAMSENRRLAWESFRRTGLESTLIGPSNLDEWIVAEHPLHEAYQYLSLVHRSDYLRPYFMFYHGGGYADIKPQTGSWLPAVNRLMESPRLIAAGYREIRGGTVWLQRNRVQGKVYLPGRAVPTVVAEAATLVMRIVRPLMIGNCAYYFKPRSRFARIWLDEAERRLDLLLCDLRKNPAKEPRDRQGWPSGYPVPWSFLLGDIFHPLSTLYFPFISRDLPRPRFTYYM